MDEIDIHLVGLHIANRPLDCLNRPLHVTFQDQLELHLLASFDQSQHIFHAAFLGTLQTLLPTLKLPLVAQLLGRPFVLHGHQFIPNVGQFGKSKHFHRDGWTGLLHLLVPIVEERLHLARIGAADKRGAYFKGSRLHYHGGGRTLPGLHLGLNHGGTRIRFGIRLQLQHLRLQCH